MQMQLAIDTTNNQVTKNTGTKKKPGTYANLSQTKDKLKSMQKIFSIPLKTINMLKNMKC